MTSVSFVDEKITINFSEYPSQTLDKILCKDCELYIGLENYLDFESQTKKRFSEVLLEWLDPINPLKNI